MQHLLKHFEAPDEVRVFPKGGLEIVTVNGTTVGRATYEPGWKWSEHVRPTAATELCEIEHVGIVLEGRAVAAMSDGTIVDLSPGTCFYSRQRRTTAAWSATSVTFPSTCRAPSTARSSSTRTYRQ
jgi:hypothetical protein